ncbi:MAG TPA: right-handed parallel beta-helix repeat-containing protein [Flavobacteriales bacterium]
MIVRPTLVLALSGLLAAPVSAQLQRIVLQGSGDPTVHTDLATAIAAAQPGDHLHLSGGTFTLTGGITLSKPLHFIGAGIHPDSSNVTATTTIATTGNSQAHVAVTTAASGSSFTGIIFSPSTNGAGFVYGTNADDDDPQGLVFQRCEFKRYVQMGAEEGANGSGTFDECIFRGASNMGMSGMGSRAVFTRCIFDGGPINNFRPSGLFMRNCVVMGSRLQNSSNAIVQNCIFSYDGAPLWQVGGVQISNCLVTGSTMFSNSSGNSETNNTYGIPAASLFVNETDGSLQFTDDLHLAAGSPGIGGGNDGRDIGLHGSNSPQKPGYVPFNPHYQQADFAPSTNWMGELPVQIRTAAQSH